MKYCAFLLPLFLAILNIEGNEFSVTSPFQRETLLNLPLKLEDANSGWKMLSKEEIKEQKWKLGFKAADYISELFCAYNLDFISEGIWEVSDWVKKEREFEKYLEEKYSVKLEIDIPKKGFIIYIHRF